jgi:alanine racemase
LYTSKKISGIIDGELSGNSNITVKYLISDSRNISFYPESAFFALVSERNNGHKYIKELFDKGVRCFIVSETISNVKYKGACFIKVHDTLAALQQLAAFHRKQFHIPIIAVTGSNGKTAVKEWLYQLLKAKFTICRSPKSYNSQIGVPLSVWNLQQHHTLGIFEAGISKVKEMPLLESIIKPNIGIFTSLGEAHREGFADLEEKLTEKFKLFEHCTSLIIQGLGRKQIPPHISMHEIILISENTDADVMIKKTKAKNHVTEIELTYKNKNYVIQIPFTDKASVINATTCFGALMALHQKPEDVVPLFKELQPIALRLEIKNGINNSVLINDFYNSDVDSLQIALNHLHQQGLTYKKVVILSDIEQSGQTNENLYAEIAKLLSQYKIEQLIGIGKNISENSNYFQLEKLFFTSTEDFIKNYNSKNLQFYNSTILLKGARSFGFEKIGQLLQQKSHDTVLEINLNRLTGNLNYYRGLLKPGTKIMCMVKAMGYGSGSSEIARTLQHVGINYLAVAYADEGVELRSASINLPVMVMSPEPDSLEDIINYHLEPEIYSFRLLELFCGQLDKSGVTDAYPIHIKIDTGMRRLGFEEDEIEKLAKTLLKHPQVKIKSVFSHLVATDNPKLDSFTKTQIELFEKTCLLLESKLGYSFLKHICNSGGISRFKNAHYDMVRLGIGMYGVGVNKAEQTKLENVGILKTRISQIKNVSKGQTVGYSRNGIVKRNSSIATIPIGYADGFKRQLGNGKFSVLVNGKKCKTVGNICMDMCMIDVTNVKCKEGDEVIVFENFRQVQSMAEALGTIPYEVLTGISSRVKRVYVQE